jgi:hypothetical protein
MQQLALFAIPKEMYGDEDDQDAGSDNVSVASSAPISVDFDWTDWDESVLALAEEGPKVDGLFEPKDLPLPGDAHDVIPGRGVEGLPLGDNTNPSKDRLPAPPLLPEGWIALLDPNTQRYYYMHLPTQSTQWEFPKDPKPAPGPFIEPIQSSIASNYKQPPDATSFPIPSTADSTTAELVGPPTVAAELPYAATAARSSVGPGYRWWVPAEGISRQVITADIQHYLGYDALVKPGPGVERNKVQLSLRNILVMNTS